MFFQHSNVDAQTEKPLQFYLDLIDRGDIDVFAHQLPPADPSRPLPRLPNNSTLLHYAARHGRTRMVLHFLDNKYFHIQSCVDDFGENALMEACRGDSLQHVDCVAQLANYPEVDLFHRNNKRMNVLEIACDTGKCHVHYHHDRKSCTVERICSILVKAGGIDLLEACSGMHMYYAIKNEHRSVVRLFLNPSQSLSLHYKYMPNLYDELPHGALRNCLSPEMAAILVEEGQADVHSRDNHFRTPLHIAASFGRSHVCKYLLEQGADPNAYDDLGKTPLFLCCESICSVYSDADWYNTASVLLENGAVINRRDFQNNLTALEYIVKYKSNLPQSKKIIEVIRKFTESSDNFNMNMFKQFAFKASK